MVIKVDKEGSEILSNAADLMLKAYGTQALQFVDILRTKVEILTDESKNEE